MGGRLKRSLCLYQHLQFRSMRSRNVSSDGLQIIIHNSPLLPAQLPGKESAYSRYSLITCIV